MRKNIDVVANMSKSGFITPIYIKWEDGRIFEIEKVLDARKKASLKGGGMGMRYTCLINSQEKYIWLDDYIWFIEL